MRDRDGEYAEDYGARAFPETFVIDRRGRIAALRRGAVNQRWLDQTLPPILAEGS
jgi:cytochrome c biogenesis protein CcmG/thiol:disulfide interchange protein DsbE